MTVVLSLLAPDAGSLLAWQRQAGGEACLGADAIEVRLDGWSSADLDQLAHDQAVGSLPWIAACHGPEGLGSLQGTLEEHFERLTRARQAGATWVDVDARYAQEHAKLDRGARIVSCHVLDTQADWRAAYQQLIACARPEDRIKFVVAVADAESGLDIMAWIAALPPWPGGRTAFCMGTAGRFTRLLAWAQPDAWVYCAPDRGHAWGGVAPSAAGQFSLAEWRLRAPRRAGQVSSWQGVVGDPIEHSLSPWMHTRALRAQARSTGYLALAPKDWDAFRRALEPWPLDGLAITAPFKSLALRDSASATDEARALGAANTWKATPQGWRASNSDPQGVRYALESAWKTHRVERGMPTSMHGARAWVFGGGGASRAAIFALRAMGCSVVLLTRNEAKGRELARELEARWITWQDADPKACDLMVHATPLGSAGRGLFLPPSLLRSHQLVLDAVYAPADTPLLQSARAIGASVVPGWLWLLGQAREQFHTLVGEWPDEQALRAGLGDPEERASQTAQGPVVLIGPRAAGKSTLGLRLGRALGWPVLDIDEAIGQSHWAEGGSRAASAGAALRAWGEPKFREVEQALVFKALQGSERGVVVLGAGAVESPGVRAALAQRGRVVWVDALPATRIARQTSDATDRPPLAGTMKVPQEQIILDRRRLDWYRELAQWGISTESEQGWEGLLAWCEQGPWNALRP